MQSAAGLTEGVKSTTSFTERSGTSFTLCDLITVWTRVGHDPLAQITEGLHHPVEPETIAVPAPPFEAEELELGSDNKNKKPAGLEGQPAEARGKRRIILAAGPAGLTPARHFCWA
jgi:hypothetical protein